MSSRILCGFQRSCCAILTACSVLTIASHAQTDEKPEKATRKLIYKVDPDYPWDLKRAHVGGVVRMIVIVTPRGTVDSISVIGGNPVLVDTAQRAIKKWKYAPADSESIIHVNVDFDPAH